MPVKDHHAKPFDEATLTKLSIYRGYVQAWLQVFLHTDKFQGKPLQFFDFFSGPGKDQSGIAGSPIILLEELQSQKQLIVASRRDIRIVFNDRDSSKIAALQKLCTASSYSWLPQYECLDFVQAFTKYAKQIGVGPSLVFLDQSGVTQITRKVFDDLACRPQTDIIFFTASSYKRRFGDLIAPEIEYPDDTEHVDAHRVFADTYRQWAPKDLLIGHFSIKKGSNIYGLVFGSHHWLGMLKFLEIAWNLDPDCGEADYEIEADCSQGLLDFNSGSAKFKMRKVEAFQADVVDLISKKRLTTDGEVVLHCIKNGVLASRVAPLVYTQLRKSGVLQNDKSCQPRHSTDAIRQPRTLQLHHGS